jgi:DNA-directed RNA polymerase subunit E'/Rpb7
MSNPYYRVTVSARVRLHPRGFDNNISDNIKQEAEKKYNHKCYLDYGYIDGIYRITDESIGVIQDEDPTSSGVYTVNMECRMLVPIPQEMIYATITGINEKMIVAETGQLKIMIHESAINSDNIKYIKNAYYPIDANKRPTGHPIKIGSPVVIRLLACKIVPKQPHIMSVGILEAIVHSDDYDKVHTNMEEPVLTMEEIEAMRGRKPDTETESELITPEGSEVESESESEAGEPEAGEPGAGEPGAPEKVEREMGRGTGEKELGLGEAGAESETDSDSYEIFSDTSDED